MPETAPTLRWTLARKAFGLTLVAVLVVMLIGGLITDRVMESDVRTAATSYLAIVVAELQIADAPTDSNVMAPLENAGPDRHAQIIDLRTGEVVAETSNWVAPVIDPGSITPQPVTLTTSLARGHRVVAAMRSVDVDTARYGVIAFIDLPTGLVAIGRWSLLATFGAILVSSAIGAGVWFSVRFAMQPVEELSRRAETIAGDSASGVWTLGTEATTEELRGLLGRLNSLLGRVRESQEREREFLEDVSHDLRTPIAVARAELDLANSSTTDAATGSALSSAIEELDRLDRRTADLLILAKVRAQPARADEDVHLGHMVRKTTARIIRRPPDHQVRVSVEGTAGLRGDPVTLERAVENVLTNAIRHAASVVEVQVCASKSEAVVSVRDDGPGFDKRMLTSATGRFARDTSRHDGSGLGLAIAIAIAEAHGGALEIRNLAEGGAEVTLRFPTAGKRGDPEFARTGA